MKVLFLSIAHGTDRSDTAHAYRLEKLRCAIQGHGVETEFLSLREQPVSRPVLLQPLNLPFFRKKIADYDLIHAGCDAGYTASLWKPFTRARIIHDVDGDTSSQMHLIWTGSPNPRKAYWLIQSLIANAVAFRHVDYFLAVSKPMQRWIIDERHIPAYRIGLVRNGVDLELFNSPTHDPAHRFTICYAGGFESWQAIDNLVSAFELLPKHQIALKIVGFTERHADLKANISGRLGDRVELVDREIQSELISHLSAAHVLIIPRYRHHAVELMFPTKFAEYLALGKPLIVCNIDETARLVQQHHCGLVSEPSPAALAETIRAASNLTQSELKHMGQNARRLAEREFSWDDIGRKYVEMLTKWGAL